MTDLTKEQRLRQERAQHMRRADALAEDRREMQADLIRQRDDMTAAIAALDAGRIADARAVLAEGLAYRLRTRKPRSTQARHTPQ